VGVGTLVYGKLFICENGGLFLHLFYPS
jgi:hypothetical protein